MPYTYIINLQLFSDMGGDGAMAESSLPATGETAEIGSDSGVETQPATANGGETVESFEDLIKGRYKEDYSKHVQDAINRRFRNQKDLEGQLATLKPMVQLAAQKYGIRPGDDGSYDYAAVVQAMSDDNSMWEEEAFKAGMSVEQYKHMRQVEAENAEFRRQREENLQEAQMREKFERDYRAAEEVKQIYPDFDFTYEVQNNPDFSRLLAVGIPVQTAYEVTHKDEIIAGGMQYAVQRTKEQVSRAVQSGSNRARENFSTGQAPATAGGLDPSKLTREQIHKMRLEAERGERITFT